MDYNNQNHEVQEKVQPLENLITIGDAQQNNMIDRSTMEFDISTKNQMETDHSISGLSKSNDNIKI